METIVEPVVIAFRDEKRFGFQFLSFNSVSKIVGTKTVNVYICFSKAENIFFVSNFLWSVTFAPICSAGIV